MIRNILKIKFWGIAFKSSFKNRILAEKPMHSRLMSIPRYISWAFISFISVAKAEPIKMTANNQPGMRKNSDPNTQSLINQSDELFSMGKFEESFKILETLKDSKDAEVLWRISRALFNMSKQKGTSRSENAALITASYDIIERALQFDNNHYAVHKWMAILVDAKSSLEGIKARINTLPIFKKHLMTAIELNPRDATSIYMLGQYMYNIADMSWLQRTIAKTLFGTPPESTFEEALHYFSKAEDIDPNFYSANLLMLGKTYLKLKRIEAARYWLKCAIAYPVRTDEDEAVRIEAEELLEKNPSVKNEMKKEELSNSQQEKN